MSSFFDPVEPQPEPKRYREPEWMGPRSNVLGAPVAVGLLLARSDEAAVWLGPATAYPNGFEIRLQIRLRSADHVHPIEVHPHRGGADGFRFGVQFADGRKAMNQFPPRSPQHEGPPEPPRLGMRGGHGGMGSWDWNFWVWGLPPAGPITFACVWPAQQLPESQAELDAAPILAAAPNAIELWPEGDPQPGGGTSSQQIIGFERPD
jgi:hypothetical protein